MEKKSYTVFGIRHHGPGSAINLLSALNDLKPDYVLIEGPPDAQGLIESVAQEAMVPPVALLIYHAKNPLQAVFYPFAKFSPEWQAIGFGLANNIPIQFMDLPQSHQLAMAEKLNSTCEPSDPSPDAIEPEYQDSLPDSAENIAGTDEPDRPDPWDPLDWFARQAGYEDGEAWWNKVVEERIDSKELFHAICDVMTGLRQQYPMCRNEDESHREQLREAWMRKAIHSVTKKGFGNIAVVCGAWHVPALLADVKLKDDNDLLRGLPKTKVECTWIPWTYSRLTRQSGYGAGINSPGWYDHLWHYRKPNCHQSATTFATRWFVRVAELLRNADLDASSAHIIEAVRLAEALASLRQRPFPGLEELNEATQAVLLSGDRAPLAFIRERLLIGDRMGKIPDNTPKVPLQTDLEKQIKRLRLKTLTGTEELDLDLRTDNGLARSHLLHRLNLLDIRWGVSKPVDSGKKGTFHEYWQIKWEPEFALSIIEASIWGTTVESAASNKAIHSAGKITAISELAGLVNDVILAELPAAIQPVVSALKSCSARTNDVGALMQALPSLVTILRYGNVRQSDSSMVSEVVDGLIIRICIGLSPACRSLDEDAAQVMSQNIVKVNHAVFLVENTAHHDTWTSTLQAILTNETIHPLLRGKICRLLFDRNLIDADHVARIMSLALSPGNEPIMAAAWIQGFLQGSGMVLIHDSNLLDVIDTWMCQLSEDRFSHILPLIRRTFSTFSPPERQQIGGRIKTVSRMTGQTASRSAGQETPFFEEWGNRAAHNAAKLLGLLP